MKERRRRASAPGSAKRAGGDAPAGAIAWRRVFLSLAALATSVAVGAVVWFGLGRGRAKGDYLPRPKGAVTFSRDIAPIVLNHCAGCHRPGQAAPFSLLTCADVRKHARQIVEVTERGYMPPWLPAAGYGEFVG